MSPTPRRFPARSAATAYDAVVVGSGAAGLTAALCLEGCRVLLVTKTRLGDGASRWAQGGMAAALGAGDRPELHARDTVAVGGGICDSQAVAVLTREAPRLVAALERWGTRFDRRPDGSLDLGREAAHGRRRILHAGGDATGAELVRALTAAVRRAPWVEVREGAFVEELELAAGRISGVRLRRRGGGCVTVASGAVVLATGGIGQAFRHTTNPPEATGDGLAMAARAGARLAGLEFVQFHPTALATGSDPLPLLTEALRGEGAVLVDAAGDRFMAAEHPQAEMAPRDVVARAIWRRLAAGTAVFLDARPVADSLPGRFPGVLARCLEQGLDPRREPVPVVPAAHYHMGGVATDLEGRTSLAGLWACGEVASTGAHGANRLASNSLLEAVVFGARVGESLRQPSVRGETPDSIEAEPSAAADHPEAAAVPSDSTRRRLRDLLWERAGLVRTGDGLAAALDELDRLAALPMRGELRNLVLVGRLVTAAALLREESRGAHFRADYPDEAPGHPSESRWTAAELAAAAEAARRRIAAGPISAGAVGTGG